MTYRCSELRDAADWIAENLPQVWVGICSPVSAMALSLYLCTYPFSNDIHNVAIEKDTSPCN